ncbi:uncharacterized protein LOC125689007 [Lagopus muta]|uniref:uncharacterized protein LOC125689007 n=1 Tax=Lagopus muta TaxID=64668 RepID=UPI00209D1A31|nr:uncharacterized protein LOC125689007 [Lagopus muta]
MHCSPPAWELQAYTSWRQEDHLSCSSFHKRPSSVSGHTLYYQSYNYSKIPLHCSFPLTTNLLRRPQRRSGKNLKCAMGCGMLPLEEASFVVQEQYPRSRSVQLAIALHYEEGAEMAVILQEEACSVTAIKIMCLTGTLQKCISQSMFWSWMLPPALQWSRWSLNCCMCSQHWLVLSHIFLLLDPTAWLTALKRDALIQSNVHIWVYFSLASLITKKSWSHLGCHVMIW